MQKVLLLCKDLFPTFKPEVLDNEIKLKIYSLSNLELIRIGDFLKEQKVDLQIRRSGKFILIIFSFDVYEN